MTTQAAADYTIQPPGDESSNMGTYLKTVGNIGSIFFVYWLCMMTIFWIERKELEHYVHPNGRKPRICQSCKDEKVNPFAPPPAPSGPNGFASPNFHAGENSAHSYNSAFNSWASPTHQQRSPNTAGSGPGYDGGGDQAAAFDAKDFYG